jgi:hypothetical protein
MELQRGKVPALDFLIGCPVPVRAALMATVTAVRDGPPPSFRGGLRWQVMHGDMGGIYEARDEHDKLLYRLFCALDRNGPKNGIDRPSVVLLGGARKAKGTEVSAGAYASVIGYKGLYMASNPRPVMTKAAMTRALRNLQ